MSVFLYIEKIIQILMETLHLPLNLITSKITSFYNH